MSDTLLLHVPAPAGWLTANQRVDRRAQTSARRAWRDAARVHAMAAHLPRSLEAAHMTAILHFIDTRRRDAHNYYPSLKAIVDGLVDYGLIEDDDDTHLIGPDIRCGPAVPKHKYPAGGLVIMQITPLTIGEIHGYTDQGHEASASTGLPMR